MLLACHGNPQAFDESQIEVLESNGTSVLPASLYEAQFDLRMSNKQVLCATSFSLTILRKSRTNNAQSMCCEFEEPE